MCPMCGNSRFEIPTTVLGLKAFVCDICWEIEFRMFDMISREDGGIDEYDVGSFKVENLSEFVSKLKPESLH